MKKRIHIMEYISNTYLYYEYNTGAKLSYQHELYLPLSKP